MKELQKRMKEELVVINRSPLLTLWVAIVAGREGHTADVSLTAGRAVARMLALAKGRSLGIFGDDKRARNTDGPARYKRFAGFNVPESYLDVPAETVRRGLQRSFGQNLDKVSSKLWALANRYSSDTIGRHAYKLYEIFRPDVSPGTAGWGQRSVLDLKIIDRLIRKAHRWSPKS